MGNASSTAVPEVPPTSPSTSLSPSTPSSASTLHPPARTDSQSDPDNPRERDIPPHPIERRSSIRTGATAQFVRGRQHHRSLNASTGQSSRNTSSVLVSSSPFVGSPLESFSFRVRKNSFLRSSGSTSTPVEKEQLDLALSDSLDALGLESESTSNRPGLGLRRIPNRIASVKDRKIVDVDDLPELELDPVVPEHNSEILRKLSLCSLTIIALGLTIEFFF